MTLTTTAPFQFNGSNTFQKLSNAFINDINLIYSNLSSSSTGFPIQEIDMKSLSIEDNLSELSPFTQNDFKFFIKSFFQYIGKYMQLLYKQIRNEWDDIFPEIFDLSIKYILKYAFEEEQPPFTSFEEHFQLAKILGLKYIPHKTVNRLAAGLQYNIIDFNWISEKNLVELKGFNRVINKKYKIAYRNFENLWKISKIENEFNKKMNQDLSQIVSI